MHRTGIPYHQVAPGTWYLVLNLIPGTRYLVLQRKYNACILYTCITKQSPPSYVGQLVKNISFHQPRQSLFMTFHMYVPVMCIRSFLHDKVVNQAGGTWYQVPVKNCCDPLKKIWNRCDPLNRRKTRFDPTKCRFVNFKTSTPILSMYALRLCH